MVNDIEYKDTPRRRVSFFKVASYAVSALYDGLKKNVSIILHDADVFLGTVFLAVGLLGFESDKYCDGNTADYLSCTRPSTYYYYDALDILLVILGAFFIIVWFLKHRKK